MNPIEDLLHDDDTPIDDGVALLSQLSAAVLWLRRGAMPGLTVWDAIEQALRWRQGTEADWREADPVRVALRVADAERCDSMAVVLTLALRSWLAATSLSFNDGISW